MLQFRSSNKSEASLLRIEPFKGMNLSVTPTQIDQSQSPDMLNMNIDERGALNKRTGYERVYAESLGEGKINGLYEYRKSNGQTYFLIAHGTKLYKQSGDLQPEQLYDGLANQQTDFFTMNDKAYILDGEYYLVYDGETVKEVEPYVPTIAISKNPGVNGGGSTLEDINLLGSGFKETFSGDGEAKEFYLSQSNLDDRAIVVMVDNKQKTDSADYTFDRAAGKVTFVTAPSKGTNNVEITAYKTHTAFPKRIKQCRFHVIYGGSNDTRVFISGNPEMPEYVWSSGLYDPTYFPENGFYKFPDKVMGFAKQYDYLIVERANGKHQITYTTNDGYASFPSKPLNDQVGTIARNSIQMLDNNPVSLSKDGVFMLTASSVRDERNVTQISSPIDQKLLREAGLEKAIAIDYEKKYWLALNGNVYVLDYGQKSQYNNIGEWYIYDNVHAACFLEKDGRLYFGSSKEGMVYRFKIVSDAYPYNDDGQAIECHWRSKVFSFGADERRKLVEKVFFSLNPAVHTSADLSFQSDKKEMKYVKHTRKDLFHYANIDYGRFSYATRDFPQEATNKIKAKKIVYFQLELSNQTLDEPIGILSLGIKFKYQSYVK